MDILEEIERESEPEMHAEFMVAGTDNEWRPFKIEKCKVCGKTPNVFRDFEIDGKGRYTLKCCGSVVKEATETKVIYSWNCLQTLPFNK